MAKSPADKVIIPSSGRWDWNDETQSLEFTSFETSADVKEKKKTTTTSTYQAEYSKHLERWQTNTVGLYQLDAFKNFMKGLQKDCVTIQDVKLAAVSLLHENEALPIPLRFLSLMKTKELDEFLASLLLYFYWYFEKKALEEKPKSLMAEENATERQMKAETCAKVELAQQKLALCYSRLLLGQGLSQQHHMTCDRSRMPSTHRDIQFYECLYSFCSYAAWVTFERRDLPGIQVEIGCLFRSNTFNPALRTPVDEFEEEDQESPKEGQSEVKNPRQTGLRKSQRRPGQNSIITQRSPLTSSLSPTPRENAPHLFGSFKSRQHSTEQCDSDALMKELDQQMNSLHFGILGEPLSQFSSKTLKPRQGKSEAEREDEEDDGNNSTVVDDNPSLHIRSSKTSFTAQRSMTTVDKHSRTSRADLVSRATTEEVSSDTE